MNISMKSRYAVRALTELARREESQPGRPVRLSEIADSRDMPLQFLEQVFAALRRAGVVRSRRGAAGGYALARPAGGDHGARGRRRARRRALAGGVHAGPVRPLDSCGASSVWIEAQAALEAVLGGTTIGDLLAREDALRERAPMYFI